MADCRSLKLCSRTCKFCAAIFDVEVSTLQLIADRDLHHHVRPPKRLLEFQRTSSSHYFQGVPIQYGMAGAFHYLHIHEVAILLDHGPQHHPPFQMLDSGCIRVSLQHRDSVPECLCQPAIVDFCGRDWPARCVSDRGFLDGRRCLWNLALRGDGLFLNRSRSRRRSRNGRRLSGDR